MRCDGEGEGACVHAVLTMRASARVRGCMGKRVMERKDMCKLKGRAIVTDMLPGLVGYCNPNPPTSSRACDRRPARVPVRCRVSVGFRLGFKLGYGLGLGIGLDTRLAKGAPRLHNPFAILVHDIPEENNPQNAHSAN